MLSDRVYSALRYYVWSVPEVEPSARAAEGRRARTRASDNMAVKSFFMSITSK